MVKGQARVKIYEGENIDQKAPLKTPITAGMKVGNTRYTIMTKKQNIKMGNQVQLHNSGIGQG